MYPSEIRRRILRGQHELERRLEALEALLPELDSRDSACAELRRSFHELVVYLCHQLTLEDALLAPALLEADAWGDVRTRHLEDAHRKLRLALGEGLDRFEAPDASPEALRTAVEDLAATLRLVFEHAQRDLLDKDVLRDDTVTIGITS